MRGGFIRDIQWLASCRSPLTNGRDLQSFWNSVVLCTLWAMRYFGSKCSTVQSLYDLVSAKVRSGSLCDPFGGIGVVGSFFKAHGYRVCSGDILTFAHYFQLASIQASRMPNFSRLRTTLGFTALREVVDCLNTAKRNSGWFVREYSEKRQFFTPDNASRIEGCRVLLRRWRNQGLLSDLEYAVLAASLINSMDKVANTAGTYYAYLKQWQRKALQRFFFRFVSPTRGVPGCRAVLADAKIVVGLEDWDVLYLDPPHNSRSYDGYYHLPETLALGAAPKTSGKAGIPMRPKRQSLFNVSRKALGALEEILAAAQFRLLVFHYSDDGIIPKADLKRLFSSVGRTQCRTLTALGYNTERKCRVVKHNVYLVERG
jgi:adenine-specific DNA-methyltransferase